MRANSELRLRWRALIGIGLIAGIAGGVVLATAAAARRTDSAYDRFLSASNASDARVGDLGAGTAFSGVDLDAVGRLPQVSESARTTAFFWVLFGPAGKVQAYGPTSNFRAYGSATTAPDESTLYRVNKPKLVAGRLPDAGRADEIAFGFFCAAQLHVHEGSRLLLRLPPKGFDLNTTPTTFPATAQVTVVGLVAIPNSSFPPNADCFSSILATPAFYRTYAGRVASYDSLDVRLENHARDLAEFKRGVDRLSGGSAQFLDANEYSTIVKRSIHFEAIALGLFSALAALAAALALVQALVRHLSAGTSENPALYALGSTRGQLFGVAMIQSGIVGLVGSVLACAVSIALSPLGPIGVARVAEPKPGLSVDPGVIGIGAVLLLVLVPVLTAGPAWRLSRRRLESDLAAGTATPSRLAAFIARFGFSPAAVTGVRMAMERGHGRAASPVRSTIAGVTIAVTAVVAALGFGASFRHVVQTPRLYGWDYDVGVGTPYGPDTAEQAVPLLRANPDVAEFSMGTTLIPIQLSSGARSVSATSWGLDPVTGNVFPTLRTGRWPRTNAEVALGVRTLRALGARLNDRVVARVGERSETVRVVGVAVFPEVNGNASPGLGSGVGVSFGLLQRLAPQAQRNMYAIRFVRGVDHERAVARLNEAFANLGGEVTTVVNATDLANVKEIDAVPLGLAGILGLIGAASLAHDLISSVRRRRRDLAILKTIGFVGRQVTAAVVWQTTAVAMVALAAGIPLGIAAGHWTWRLFAEELGAVPQPVLSLGAVLLVLPGTMLLANAVAALPARSAARTQPAAVLRTE